MTKTDVDRDHDGAANDAHDQEHIPTHPRKPQKDYGIEAEGFHERVLSGT